MSEPSGDVNQNFDLSAVRSVSTDPSMVPSGRAGSRPPGHNRPKNASDWMSQIALVVVGLVIIVLFGSAGNGAIAALILVVFVPYIALIEWLSHLEDRTKANRIWAVIWAVSAILAVRAHEQRKQANARDYRAPQPPPPGSRNGIDYGQR